MLNMSTKRVIKMLMRKTLYLSPLIYKSRKAGRDSAPLLPTLILPHSPSRLYQLLNISPILVAQLPVE